ncbi:patatin-like phospholipase family protein [Desulfoferrobacter suflitae]|uniref:patatin-like phospholipase family protein n=1 Tax=Desulfoferrobacter suflitae TaxID=2865782 RepID=UPI00216430B1|nr:patatin-like phospholipase family protein [Desulfoferrobacter suflitae]MCK8603414.1 patatin-like phospholipase family protein [Desulfoferrobacter suflitae]
MPIKGDEVTCQDITARRGGRRRAVKGCLTLDLGKLALLVCCAAVSLSFQNCAILKLNNPLPVDLENRVQMPGMPGVRAWGDEYSKSFERSALESVEEEKVANNGELEPVVYVLSLSGGGAEGAFGAGILCGWTKAGTRPQFKMVTGISTGALMAPFAFLGSDYDQQLEKFYTTISSDDIYQPYGPLTILLSLANLKALPSMADSRPLTRLVARVIDANLLQKVAQEHLKGRRLLIGTTQLDAQRLVIWNMGAIAVSAHPQALELFRKIMVASASIPVMFPPQNFEVEAAGQNFQEMHVDGGTRAQVMLYESSIRFLTVSSRRSRRLFIIRNEQVHPEWQDVKRQLKYIAIRSIDTLLKSQGVGDLFRLYVFAQRDQFDYNLAYIPPDFTSRPISSFDTAYMNQLFQLGYQLARRGQPWRKYPPGYEPAPLGE